MQSNDAVQVSMNSEPSPLSVRPSQKVLMFFILFLFYFFFAFNEHEPA